VSHPTTEKGRLLRLGFVDAAQAEWGLTRLGPEAAEPLVALIARTADPDLSLASLVRLLDAAGEQEGGRLLAALVDDEGTAMRLLSVLGASEALAASANAIVVRRKPRRSCRANLIGLAIPATPGDANGV